MNKFSDKSELFDLTDHNYSFCGLEKTEAYKDNVGLVDDENKEINHGLVTTIGLPSLNRINTRFDVPSSLQEAFEIVELNSLGGEETRLDKSLKLSNSTRL